MVLQGFRNLLKINQISLMKIVPKRGLFFYFEGSCPATTTTGFAYLNNIPFSSKILAICRLFLLYRQPDLTMIARTIRVSFAIPFNTGAHAQFIFFIVRQPFFENLRV